MTARSKNEILKPIKMYDLTPPSFISIARRLKVISEMIATPIMTQLKNKVKKSLAIITPFIPVVMNRSRLMWMGPSGFPLCFIDSYMKMKEPTCEAINS